MQNQKTLAKWLAVVLLLMIAIACYVALSAILKKENKAADTSASASEMVAPAPTQNTEPVPEHVPVYSTFPRRAEQIGGTFISHVGGENDEMFLATYTLDDKTLIIFSSDSAEYDVKGAGIHIATLANNNVLGTKQIADANEEYLTSTLSSNGILLVTRDARSTILRQITLDCNIMAEITCPRFDSALTTIDNLTKKVQLFATDGSFLYAYTLDDSMNISRSSFAYSAHDLTLKTVVDYGTYQLLFAETNDAFEIISFAKNSGFYRKNRLLNCRLLQIEPNISTSNYSFAGLFEKQDNDKISLLVCTFDKSGNTQNSYIVDEAESGVLKQDGESILLFTLDAKYQFCTHLELVLKSKYDVDNSRFVGTVHVKNIDGSPLFLRTDGMMFQVVDTDSKVKFSALGNNLQLVQYSNSQTAKTRLFYQAKSGDSLSYMVFGGYDILVVDTTF